MPVDIRTVRRSLPPGLRRKLDWLRQTLGVETLRAEIRKLRSTGLSRARAVAQLFHEKRVLTRPMRIPGVTTAPPGAPSVLPSDATETPSNAPLRVHPSHPAWSRGRHYGTSGLGVSLNPLSWVGLAGDSTLAQLLALRVNIKKTWDDSLAYQPPAGSFLSKPGALSGYQVFFQRSLEALSSPSLEAQLKAGGTDRTNTSRLIASTQTNYGKILAQYGADKKDLTGATGTALAKKNWEAATAESMRRTQKAEFWEKLAGPGSGLLDFLSNIKGTAITVLVVGAGIYLLPSILNLVGRSKASYERGKAGA